MMVLVLAEVALVFVLAFRSRRARRMFRAEFALWVDLYRLVRRRVVVPPGAVAVPASPSLLLPLALTAATAIEIVVVELVISLWWVRVVVAVVSLYSLAILWAFVMGPRIYPHYLADSELVLRAGRTVVARIPAAVLNRARRDRDYGTPSQRVEGDTLTLAGVEGTNLRLELKRPVEAQEFAWPWQSAQTREVASVRLGVDDPETFITQMDTLKGM